MRACRVTDLTSVLYAAAARNFLSIAAYACGALRSYDMSGLVCVYDIPVNTTVVLPDVLFHIDSHLIVLS